MTRRSQVTALLARNRDLVGALRDALMERDELVGDEIVSVIRSALDRRGQPAPAAPPAPTNEEL